MQSNVVDILSVAVEDNKEDLRMMALKLILKLCAEGKLRDYALA